MEYIWIAVLCLVGSFVQGTTGFGFSLIAMSVLSAFLPFKTAQMLGLFTCVPMFLYIAFKNIKKINFKLLVVPTISAVISIIFFVTLIKSFDDSILKKILGVVLILLSVYFIFFSKKIRLKKNLPTQIAVGTLSGSLSALCNMGGPPAVLYFLNTTNDSVEYNSTLQFFFIFTFAVNLVTQVLNGNYTNDILQYLPYSLSGTVVGTIVGAFVAEKINFDILKIVVYFLIGGIGIFLLAM